MNVTSSAGCSYTAVSNAPWITILSGSSRRLGSGAINYSVGAHRGTTSRTGTVTIADQVFTVTQAGAAPSSGYKLTVTKSGTGSGGVYVDMWKASYPPGTRITLTEEPNEGSKFGGWSGGCSGTSPECPLVMNSDITVNATFLLLTK